MRVTEGTQAPEFTFSSPWEANRSFHAAIEGGPSVLFFLRYVGCPLCQLKISEIRRDLARFTAANARLFVVLQSAPEFVRPLAARDAGFTVICDPAQSHFRLYDVTPGNILHYIAPSVILKAARAKRAGFTHGAREGNEMQRPAVFVMNAMKTVVFAHYGTTIGDVPDNGVIIGRLVAPSAARA